MNEKERVYFERRTNYKPRKIKILYGESEEEIHYSASAIRNLAKDALDGAISPNEAKKEISNLLNIIKELNKKQI